MPELTGGAPSPTDNLSGLSLRAGGPSSYANKNGVCQTNDGNGSGKGVEAPMAKPSFEPGTPACDVPRGTQYTRVLASRVDFDRILDACDRNGSQGVLEGAVAELPLYVAAPTHDFARLAHRTSVPVRRADRKRIMDARYRDWHVRFGRRSVAETRDVRAPAHHVASLSHGTGEGPGADFNGIGQVGNRSRDRAFVRGHQSVFPAQNLAVRTKCASGVGTCTHGDCIIDARNPNGLGREASPAIDTST
jgi:hypothetical protein